MNNPAETPASEAAPFFVKEYDEESKSDEKKIEIKINDDGPGIPEDIFKKFGEPYIKSKSK